MRNVRILVISFLLVVMGVLCPAKAEVVTVDEAFAVAQNWIALIIDKEGSWGGAEMAYVDEIYDFKRGGGLLGYFCHVSPRGHIIVPVSKRLAPIKAYSEVSERDPESEEGICGVVKSHLEAALRELDGELGSPPSRSTLYAQSLVESTFESDWKTLSLESGAFKAELACGLTALSYSPGSYLLTSIWTQREPYNAKCPSGGSCDHCRVGCVPLAAAQIMRYWAWPPDYDWGNMPDSLVTFSPQAQIDAVATLCHDIGKEAGTDYGCSDSTTWCGDKIGKDMTDAYKDHFAYSNSVHFDWRTAESNSSWYGKIRENIDSGRPLQYCTASADFAWPCVTGHSLVLDGYQTVGNAFQGHMNDGGIEWVDMSNRPGIEGMITGIRPWCAQGPILMGGVLAAYFDQDADTIAGSSPIHYQSGECQFLPGVRVGTTLTLPGPSAPLKFTGGSLSPTIRLFSIKGTSTASIKIVDNGALTLSNKGSIRFF